jgi:ArsR family transcriptional regulator
MKQPRPDFTLCVRALKALADARRLRTAALLAYAGRELCVCELVDALGDDQYNVSRSLGALCAAGLVSKEKKGRWAMYKLAGTGPLRQYLSAMVRPAPCCGLIAKDAARLEKRLALREKDICVVGCNC